MSSTSNISSSPESDLKEKLVDYGVVEPLTPFRLNRNEKIEETALNLSSKFFEMQIGNEKKGNRKSASLTLPPEEEKIRDFTPIKKKSLSDLSQMCTDFFAQLAPLSPKKTQEKSNIEPLAQEMEALFDGLCNLYLALYPHLGDITHPLDVKLNYSEIAKAVQKSCTLLNQIVVKKKAIKFTKLDNNQINSPNKLVGQCLIWFLEQMKKMNISSPQVQVRSMGKSLLEAMTTSELNRLLFIFKYHKSVNDNFSNFDSVARQYPSEIQYSALLTLQRDLYALIATELQTRAKIHSKTSCFFNEKIDFTPDQFESNVLYPSLNSFILLKGKNQEFYPFYTHLLEYKNLFSQEVHTLDFTDTSTDISNLEIKIISKYLNPQEELKKRTLAIKMGTLIPKTFDFDQNIKNNIYINICNYTGQSLTTYIGKSIPLDIFDLFNALFENAIKNLDTIPQNSLLYPLEERGIFNKKLKKYKDLFIQTASLSEDESLKLEEKKISTAQEIGQLIKKIKLVKDVDKIPFFIFLTTYTQEQLTLYVDSQIIPTKVNPINIFDIIEKEIYTISLQMYLKNRHFSKFCLEKNIPFFALDFPTFLNELGFEKK